ncbi:MAG: prephenate dehydratase [Thermoleophilaceae bacterium]|nr:prephenate dehydratase [Thermoleophilaceae bacterium]
MRVAFLGPAGTYTEEALRSAPPPEDHEPVPYATVHDAVMAVHEGAAERALVPIENSLEGGVAATLDALAGEASDVRIAGEVIMPIRHALVAGRELALDEIEVVVSHPQATAQCAGFLRERLPGAQRRAMTSTAEAVRAVAGGGEPWAALGSVLAAELYGATVLMEGVEDGADNLTRFVWLAREGSAPLGQPDKTSIVFWGFNDESPGALVAILAELADRGINLTKIESRPGRVRLGHYKMFADLEGGEGEEPVVAALDAVRGHVDTLRVLGSYPAAT